jgi:hypothetical protein
MSERERWMLGDKVYCEWQGIEHLVLGRVVRFGRLGLVLVQTRYGIGAYRPAELQAAGSF